MLSICLVHHLTSGLFHKLLDHPFKMSKNSPIVYTKIFWINLLITYLHCFENFKSIMIVFFKGDYLLKNMIVFVSGVPLLVCNTSIQRMQFALRMWEKNEELILNTGPTILQNPVLCVLAFQKYLFTRNRKVNYAASCILVYSLQFAYFK